MNSAQGLIVDPVAPDPLPQRPIASWYTPGMSDGLGDRLLMFDNSGAASLELLRFRPAFAAVPGFERALRQRVDQLATFKHAAFSEVRTVERLDGEDGLTLVSIHTPGKRLSEMFDGPRGPVHPPFAASLIRQLAPALAEFHARHEGVAHGALTADRIVMTPDGRVVIIEQFLGAALEELQLSASRLWRDLGVIAPAGGNAIPRLNARADFMQLGLATLALLLGRRITPDDYPHNLDLLLDEFAHRAVLHSPALVPRLRLWLERALHVYGEGLGISMGVDGLTELAEADARHLLDFRQPPALQAVASSPEPRMTNTAFVSTADAAPSGDPIDIASAGPRTTIVGNEPAREVWRRDPATTIQPPAADDGETVGWRTLATSHRRFVLFRNVAAVLAVLTLMEGAALVRLLTMRTAAPAPAPPIPLVIESPTSGDAVIVDGRQVGVTPLAMTVGSSMRSIRVVGREPAAVPLVAGPAAAVVNATRTIGAGPNGEAGDPRAKAAAAQAASAIALAASRQRSGGVRVSSPIEIHVFEGDRVLGSSADGPIVTTAGIHRLDLVNTALGFRAQQTVEIKAGQIVPLTVRPPDGRVSINALPWAQVWIDGNPVGETPLANLTVPAGQHEITFRHPQLGERRETTIVQSGTLTRVSATLGR